MEGRRETEEGDGVVILSWRQFARESRDSEQGQLIAYVGRAIDGQEPKYRFPAGFRKSLVLFNLHRVLKTNARTMIVVEGFFDALAVHQGGYPAVAALMGSTLSRQQADLLTTHFDRVLLMLGSTTASIAWS